MKNLKRIAVAGFHHETNCFIPGRTNYDYFASHRDRPPLVRKNDVLHWLAPSTGSFALAGFLSALPTGTTPVPLLWASGGAGAVVTAEAFERISAEMIGELSRSLPVDAIYLDLHGAMVTETFDDGEGELLRRIRCVVGDQVPIVASLDYHANVTSAMVSHADALLAYQTYPHVDRVQTGQRAAAVLEQLLISGRPIGRTLIKIPFLIPLNSQSTLVHPSSTVVNATQQEVPGSYCLSYLAGFPSSDLEACGPSVVAYAVNQAIADTEAKRVATMIENLEPEFVTKMLPADDAVAQAVDIARHADKPVVIADTQDNPGCGGTSDTTGLLHALLAHADLPRTVLGFFCDPQAAEAAHAAHEKGVREISLSLGGRHGPEPVTPLTETFTVVTVGTGKFNTDGKVIGKREADLGPMALLRINHIDIVVTSKRMQAHDLAPFQHLSVDVRRYAIIVLKSTCHFRAEFEPLASEVIVALAPGAFAADPSALPYRRLRADVRRTPVTA